MDSALLGGDAVVTTVAGGGPGNGVPALSANVEAPRGVALDRDGNLLIGSRLRVYLVNPSGTLFVIAGCGAPGVLGDGGPASEASFSEIFSIALDSEGNLYISDTGSHRVRRVEAGTGIIGTYAGGGFGLGVDGVPAGSCGLARPAGLAFDRDGNLYIAESGLDRVRRVDRATRIITTFAGKGLRGFGGDGGSALSAALAAPLGLAFDAAGDLFIADSGNHRVRRVDAASGNISTVAGSGVTGSCPSAPDGIPAVQAILVEPYGVAVDSAGNLLISDFSLGRIRRVDAGTGEISAVAGACSAGVFCGDGGPAASACLAGPAGIAAGPSGDLYLADLADHRVRRVDAATGNIDTVAGNGASFLSGDGRSARSASLGSPSSVALDGGGNLFIADLLNNRVRKVDSTSGIITTVAGGLDQDPGDGEPADSVKLGGPSGVAVDPAGNLYLVETFSNRLRRVDALTGRIETLAGNGFLTGQVDGPGGDPRDDLGDGGPASQSTLGCPRGVCRDAAGNLYVADTSNYRVRRIDALTGAITTVAGDGVPRFNGDGIPGSQASLNSPSAVAVDGAGNLYIADTLNHRIRRLDAGTAIISTVAGTGTIGDGGDGGPAVDARLAAPQGIALDDAGNLLIADTENHRIRMVQAGSGLISILVGKGDGLFGGDGGPALLAGLSQPTFVVPGSGGALYIADSASSRVRLVTPAVVTDLPPDCAAATLSLTSCWPPNHEFLRVEVLGVIDPDGEPVRTRITGVSQDDPVDEPEIGSGNTCPDAVLVDADGNGTTESAGLRCERAASSHAVGRGRIYTVNFTAEDPAGNQCTGSARFCVPKDDEPGSVCEEGPDLFDSLHCDDPGAGGNQGTGKAPVLTLAEFEALTPEPLFFRGDVNLDGLLDLSDAVFLLGALFQKARNLPCPDAADGNDDGELDISDAVTLLRHLFGGGGPALREPFATLGPDPTPDHLDCE